ncbi:phage portal protein, HK97 family [Rhodopseudomonas palustris TIE-1]|uniref:phage portal protein n=1 Tax=Rhodopseudomonas palustris TaxID=1076 RepID=UPI000177973D|nr:phage portal protein [Rhodopseudomonas palustris]ACF02471.1 phage portal protein, HK97 family [Rhodopseudomonas palustris TIE-1]
MTIASRVQSWFGLEKKAGIAAPEPWLFELFGAQASGSSIRVTPRIAMECAPVACAVNAISQAVGLLPVHILKRGTDGAKDRAPEHPAYRLLHHEANEWTPAGKLRQEVTRDALLYKHGGFAEIIRVGDGRPFELIRIDPEVSPITVTMTSDGPAYAVQEDGITRQIDRANILHIPSPSLSGLGLAHDARKVIGLSLLMERHAERLFANGARPSGLLSLKGNISTDTLKNARAAWNAQHSAANSGGTAVLPADVVWQSLTLNSADAQFLELRKYQIEETSRIFRVPPHLLYEMGRATWGNSEQVGQEFLDFSLMHWVSAWEGEIRLKLFDREERDKYIAEFFTDGFARADLAARMDAYSKAIAARILSPNEARAAENRPPYSGGDRFENPNTTASGAAA